MKENVVKDIFWQRHNAGNRRVFLVHKLDPPLAVFGLIEPEAIRRKHGYWYVATEQLNGFGKPDFRKQRPATVMCLDVLLGFRINVKRWVHDDERYGVSDFTLVHFQIIFDFRMRKTLILNINTHNMVSVALPRLQK